MCTVESLSLFYQSYVLLNPYLYFLSLFIYFHSYELVCLFVCLMFHDASTPVGH